MPGTGCEQHPAPTAAVKGVGGGLTAAAAAARSHLPPPHRHRSRGRRRRCAGRQRRAPSGAWDTRAARCQEATLDKALHDSTGIHDVGHCQGVHPHGSTRDRAMDADGVQRLCNRATATSHSAPKLVEHSPQEARSRKHDGCRPTEQTANPLYQPRAAEHRGAAAQSALQCDPECQHGAMTRRGPYVDLDTGSASYAAAVHRMRGGHGSGCRDFRAVLRCGGRGQGPGRRAWRGLCRCGALRVGYQDMAPALAAVAVSAALGEGGHGLGDRS